MKRSIRVHLAPEVRERFEKKCRMSLGKFEALVQLCGGDEEKAKALLISREGLFAVTNAQYAAKHGLEPIRSVDAVTPAITPAWMARDYPAVRGPVVPVEGPGMAEMAQHTLDAMINRRN